MKSRAGFSKWKINLETAREIQILRQVFQTETQISFVISCPEIEQKFVKFAVEVCAMTELSASNGARRFLQLLMLHALSTFSGFHIF